MSWRTLVPVAVAIGLIILLGRGLQLTPGKIPSPFIGKPAPDFDLPSLHAPEVRVTRADWLGRPFVVNVWGTWCPECYREHATLLRIKQEGRIPLVGINWRDDRASAMRYLQEAGDPFAAVGFDPQGDAAIDWGVYGAPETFLVDAGGVVIYKHFGAIDWDIWQTEFVQRVTGTTP